jgi:hypothetical protein
MNYSRCQRIMACLSALMFHYQNISVYSLFSTTCIFDKVFLLVDTCNVVGVVYFSIAHGLENAIRVKDITSVNYFSNCDLFWRSRESIILDN